MQKCDGKMKEKKKSENAGEHTFKAFDYKENTVR